jgi:hypothetical protein
MIYLHWDRILHLEKGVPYQHRRHIGGQLQQVLALVLEQQPQVLVLVQGQQLPQQAVVAGR